MWYECRALSHTWVSAALKCCCWELWQCGQRGAAASFSNLSSECLVSLGYKSLCTTPQHLRLQGFSSRFYTGRRGCYQPCPLSMDLLRIRIMERAGPAWPWGDREFLLAILLKSKPFRNNSLFQNVNFAFLAWKQKLLVFYVKGTLPFSCHQKSTDLFVVTERVWLSEFNGAPNHTNPSGTFRGITQASWQGFCENYLTEYLQSLGPFTAGKCEESQNKGCPYPVGTLSQGPWSGLGTVATFQVWVGPITSPQPPKIW